MIIEQKAAAEAVNEETEDYQPIPLVEPTNDPITTYINSHFLEAMQCSKFKEEP